MAYTSTVEFVWLPAATSPRPGPPSKNPDPFKAAHALPALHRASSPDAASRRKQLIRNQWRERFEGTSGGKVDCVAALATTGERFRPAFFAVFPVAAAPCAKLEQKANFCLHAYAVHGIYVYIGVRMAAGGDFARPARPLKIQFLPRRPTPSPLFTAPASRHRRSPFSCRACSCSRRSEAAQEPYGFCRHCERSEAIHGHGECGHARLFSACPRSPPSPAPTTEQKVNFCL